MTANAPRSPYLLAACASAGVFALYALTLAPTTAWWDASEYIATGHTLGIPHPPGNPLFVALARTWSILLAPLGLSPAVRVNLLAAATSAGASFFFYLIAHRTLAQLRGPGKVARVGAGVAVLIGATAFTVWSQSNANEKVYTVSLLIVAAVSWLVLRWRDLPPDDRRGPAMLVACVYLMALGAANHLMSVLPAAAFAACVALTRARPWDRAARRVPGRVPSRSQAPLRSPAFVARCLLAVAVGLSFNFFLPVRAAQRPVINEGDPLCDGFGETAVAIYTFGAAGCPALASSLSREQYAKPPVTMRMAPFTHQLHNFFQYFDWQWSRGLDPDEPPSPRRLPFTLLFLALGALGLATAWQRDRGTGVYLLILSLTLSLGLVYYLNFRYGYSLAPEIADLRAHEVRERDYFFLLGFALWGVLAGLGLVRCWLWLADRTGSAWLASPVLAVAALPLAFNLPWANRAGDYSARDYAYNLLSSIEPYGVLFTNGDNDTFPLWYLQQVEGIRRDVTVIVVQYLSTDWYPQQIRELTAPERQRPFVAAAESAGAQLTGAQPTYENRPPPARAAITLDDDALARIRSGPLPDTFGLRIGNTYVRYPSGVSLSRGHRIALAIIAESSAERPIYFAGSAGEMAALHLRGWSVREGLAARLHVRALDGPQPPSYRKTPSDFGGEWVNYPRTAHLLDQVYSYRGLRNRAIWPDDSVANIPLQYYLITNALAATAIGEGEGDRAERFATLARDFLEVHEGGREARRSR